MLVDTLQRHQWWLDQINQHDTVILRHQKSRLQKAILELFNKTGPGERRAELIRFWLRLNYTLTTSSPTTITTANALNEEYQEEIYEYSFSLVAVISGIFVFLTLAATIGVIVFCTKRNSVFSSARSKRSTSRDTVNSYEMTDASLTDIEYTDYETETEVDEPHSVVSFIQESDYEDETPLVSPSSEIPQAMPTSAHYGSTHRTRRDMNVNSLFDPGPSTSGVSSTTSLNIKKSQSYNGRLYEHISPNSGDESDEDYDTIHCLNTDDALLACSGKAPLGKSLIRSAKQKGIAMAKSVKKSISFDSKFKYREIRE
ncbi:uncharacterized protein LOC106172392 [Lingula anatina]|uniref:Uncharacterized protein LOC106172392 n=1 Tax=Lingula anatina TaxID=7574 RepID=A0A1S3JF60_LINAN|nr:uncharacterized protein LOC106172392 [Lingula anatina]|eukprot:XP_013408529.1 uncharacterized protein LOC106172392 [Lingula anatina]